VARSRAAAASAFSWSFSRPAEALSLVADSFALSESASNFDLIDRRGFVPLPYAEIEGDIDQFFAVVFLRHHMTVARG
jgi:hypothetical protein